MTCIWYEDEGGIWQTDCEEVHEFMNDEGPDDNCFQFCPFCGKPLVEESLQGEED